MQVVNMTVQGYILPPPSCRASLIFSPPPPFKKNKYSLSLGLMDWNKWWNLFVHLTVLKCQRLYAPQSFCVPAVTSPRLCCCSERWCKNSHLNGCNAMLGNVELAPNNIVCPLFDYIQCVCVRVGVWVCPCACSRSLGVCVSVQECAWASILCLQYITMSLANLQGPRADLCSHLNQA